MRIFYKFFFLSVFLLAGATLYAFAFTGPVLTPGSGSGAIVSDSSNNIGIGASATQANTKFLITAPAPAQDYALKILKSDGSPIFFVRNDGKISIATTSVISTLTVDGTIYSTNNFTGSVSASNITGGVFGAGNFSFPSSLGIGTSTQVGLPQSLSVYGGGFFSGNVGIGTINPWYPLSVLSDGSLAPGAATYMNVAVFDNANFSRGIWLGYDSGVANIALIGADIGPGTNSSSLAFVVNNGGGNGGWSEAMRINNLGNVGIGTAIPSSRLTVSGNIYATGNITCGGVCGGGSSSSSSSGSISTSSPITAFNFPYWATAGGGLSGTSTIFYSSSTGNVGIGTTLPNSALNIAGVDPKLTLSDTDAGVDLKHWYMQSSDGSLVIATTSDALVSGQFPAIKITSEGSVLIKQTGAWDFSLPITSALGVGGDISLSGINGETRTIKVEPPYLIGGNGGSLAISAASGQHSPFSGNYGYTGGAVSITGGSADSSDSSMARAGGAINITAGNSGYTAGASVVLNGGTGSTSGNVLLSSLRGNVGIGTAGPNAKLQVTGGDAAITTQGNGIILRATDGANCYRVTVNNAGTLATASVTCP